MKERKLRNIEKFPLSPTEIKAIGRLLISARLTPVAVAEMFHITAEEVIWIKKAHQWARYTRYYNVAGENEPEILMTVSEIASVVGMSRAAVNYRVKMGIRGPLLLAPAGMLPRLIDDVGNRARKVRQITKPISPTLADAIRKDFHARHPKAAALWRNATEQVRRSDFAKSNKSIEPEQEQVMVLDEGE